MSGVQRGDTYDTRAGSMMVAPGILPLASFLPVEWVLVMATHS